MKVVVFGFIAAALATAPVFADCAACSPTGLRLPPIVAAFGQAPAPFTYVNFTLSNLGAGLSLGNGLSQGWCVDSQDFWLQNATYRVFATTGSNQNLPAPYNTVKWNSINYVLNHKAGYNIVQIQSVIWKIEGQPLLYGDLDQNATLLYNAALSTGANFSPSQDDEVAVLLFFDPALNDGRAHQSMILEVSCPLTQGYWKNHPNAWPVQTLTIGGVTLTETQLLSIFDTPVRGNAAIDLLHQLIAAMLNQAHGAYLSPSALQTITAANTALQGLITVNANQSVTVGFSSSAVLTQESSTLDKYNEGLLTGLCAN
jgi:hypothetical protein